jgi:hypothetical protein
MNDTRSLESLGKAGNSRGIVSMCRAMGLAGISVDKQLDVLWYMGISIGQGGPGGAGSQTYIECPYCRQTGNGGHGGNCPNMSSEPSNWIPVNTI